LETLSQVPSRPAPGSLFPFADPGAALYVRIRALCDPSCYLLGRIVTFSSRARVKRQCQVLRICPPDGTRFCSSPVVWNTLLRSAKEAHATQVLVFCNSITIARLRILRSTNARLPLPAFKTSLSSTPPPFSGQTNFFRRSSNGLTAVLREHA
jgi:hypothetical protein